MPDAPIYGPLSDTRRTAALAVLVLVYTSNFIDRTILSVLAQPIKEELALADWQLGVLGGLSFALFYSVLGLPIARLAERVDRTWIISVSLALWSAMTVLCGSAGSYLQLLACRVGVGVGEAGGTPPAHGLLSDYYPPRQRATALSVYGLGVPLGSMFGAVLGGAAAEAFGWRGAFVVVGAPGLLLAVVAKLVLKEAPRGWWEAAPPAPAPPLSAVVTALWRKRCARELAAGITLASFTGYALVAFSASHFVRAFGLSLAEAGLAAGATSGLAAAVGTLLGGVLTDALGRRDRRWYAGLPALGLLLAAPLYAAAFLQSDWRLAVLLLLPAGACQYLYLGPTYATVHNMVEPRMRATATALLLLVVNLVGLGLGPTLVGLASDTFAAGQSGAAASAEGLRRALVAASGVFVWAALHYGRATRSLREDLLA
jgi:MFS family permease